MPSDPVLILGANGNLGKLITASLLTQKVPLVLFGHSSLPPASEGVKSIQGSLVANDPNLLEAVKGVGAVVHCASSRARLKEIDIDGTLALVDALKKQHSSVENLPRIIYISIVDVDKNPEYFYFKAKLDVENILIASGLPYTILRTAQWHPFIKFIADELLGLKDPSINTVSVPRGVDIRPLAIEEVAAKMVDLVLNDKAEGLLPDMVGPQFLSMEEAVAVYLHSQSRKVKLELYEPTAEEYPDTMFRAMTDNAVDPIDKNAYIVGHQTWEEYLGNPNSTFW
ncbi:NAD(P)-binding protein [Basidiobolus meristosporus CBS 931.73]|uniref:NAD(P)-binding protein n=1 Tax=Basidiobolus meristosporus CBS 931.73 TaxID=1314790 RepID=A0A1Y1W3D9_9FUNG|nr:NAD(P)-binding protein [Basidiobolus meristosporus CBS 931.73]|eukprot:ORX68059.1 NAD(P)-binding protein [Basidiobolus meristosporus CBS 931.73]